MGKKAGIAIRVNPDVDPEHPPLHHHRPEERQVRHHHRAGPGGVQAGARAWPGIEIIGIDCHIGSQLTKVSPFVDSIKKLKRCIGKLTGHGDRPQVFRPGRRPGHPVQRRSTAAAGGLRQGDRGGNQGPRAAPALRAGAQPGRQRRHPGGQMPLHQGAGREELHHDRRRDERPGPAGPLRLLPRRAAGGARTRTA